MHTSVHIARLHLLYDTSKVYHMIWNCMHDNAAGPRLSMVMSMQTQSTVHIYWASSHMPWSLAVILSTMHAQTAAHL